MKITDNFAISRENVPGALPVDEEEHGIGDCGIGNDSSRNEEVLRADPFAATANRQR
jgi:hypothetical protein